MKDVDEGTNSTTIKAPSGSPPSEPFKANILVNWTTEPIGFLEKISVDYDPGSSNTANISLLFKDVGIRYYKINQSPSRRFADACGKRDNGSFCQLPIIPMEGSGAEDDVLVIFKNESDITSYSFYIELENLDNNLAVKTMLFSGRTSGTGGGYN